MKEKGIYCGWMLFTYSGVSGAGPRFGGGPAFIGTGRSNYVQWSYNCYRDVVIIGNFFHNGVPFCAETSGQASLISSHHLKIFLNLPKIFLEKFSCFTHLNNFSPNIFHPPPHPYLPSWGCPPVYVWVACLSELGHPHRPLIMQM